MFTSLMVFHVVISVLLIGLVLLQFGKGAEAGLLGGSDSVMTGAQQGNIFSKATIIVSIIFLMNCVVLAKMQNKTGTSSIFDNEAPVAAPLNSDPVEKAFPETQTQEKAAEPKANSQEAQK